MRPIIVAALATSSITLTGPAAVLTVLTLREVRLPIWIVFALSTATWSVGAGSTVRVGAGVGVALGLGDGLVEAGLTAGDGLTTGDELTAGSGLGAGEAVGAGEGAAAAARDPFVAAVGEGLGEGPGCGSGGGHSHQRRGHQGQPLEAAP